MKYLLAESDRQLGKCLKFLLSEGFGSAKVDPVMNENRKIEFHVTVDTD